jgi:hypothetical protein
MAKTIKPIADSPDAETTGQISDTGGGPLPAAAETDSGSIGSMREDADLLDAIVEDAMRRRRLQAWCPSPDDFTALEAIAEETGRSLNELLDEALHLLLERRGRQQPRSEEEETCGRADGGVGRPAPNTSSSVGAG